jgi:AmmeMemoRadiSam system protein A
VRTSCLESAFFFGYVSATREELSTMLTHELKRELLKIARRSISHALQDSPAYPDDTGGPTPKELMRPGGAFVTIRLNGELRGCIGYLESGSPIAEVVSEVAVKAAFEDPRFPPVRSEELEHATLEVSVLSPIRRIYSSDELRVGEHGVILELGFSKGVLLPQVATEYGWDGKQFLEAVCRKSGLHRLAWQEPDARLSVFSAEVFEEDEVLREQST